jgi:hypothetical protein
MQAEDAACHVGGPQKPHHQGEEAQAGGGGEVGRIRKVKNLLLSS